MTIQKAISLAGFNLLRWYAETLENYYPGRVKKVLVVNPPFGTTAIISALSAVLPSSFTQKMEVVYETTGLFKYMDPSEVPMEYGGTNPLPLTQGARDVALLQYVERLNTSTSSVHSGTERGCGPPVSLAGMAGYMQSDACGDGEEAGDK